MTATVKKIGGVIVIVIPEAIAHEMELAEGTALEISSSASGILLRKQGRRPRRSMAQLVKQIKASTYARRRGEFSSD